MANKKAKLCHGGSNILITLISFITESHRRFSLLKDNIVEILTLHPHQSHISTLYTPFVTNLNLWTRRKENTFSSDHLSLATDDNVTVLRYEKRIALIPVFE